MLESNHLHAINNINENGFFNEKQVASSTSCCVKVALRIRPQLPMEKNSDCKDCVTQINNTEISIGKDRLFTFDRTFGQNSRQIDVFEICIKNLILGCFEGYIHHSGLMPLYSLTDRQVVAKLSQWEPVFRNTGSSPEQSI
jgi:hypothetical protein